MREDELYTIGLGPSAILGLLGAAAMLYFTSAEFLLAKAGFNRFKAATKALFLALASGASVVLLTYPILNPAIQDYYSLSELVVLELGSGVMGLRVASFLLAARALLYLAGPLLSYSSGRIGRMVRALDISDEPGLQISMSAQFSIFLSTAAFLWSFAILGINDFSVQLVRWGLFFIADDWLILSYYEGAFWRSGRQLPLLHQARLAAFNVCFAVYLPYVLLTEVACWAGTIAALFLLSCVILRYKGKRIEPDLEELWPTGGPY